MIRIISKQIIALRDIPRMYHEPFDRIQEWLNGVNPMAPSQKHHDSGKLREVFPDLSPAGPAETGGAGDDLSHKDVKSGYEEDLALYGGRADDGNPATGAMGVDHEQNYKDHTRTFDNESDLSSATNPMNEESNKRDRNPTNNLRFISQQPKIQPRFQPRRRAAQVWQHTFKV